MAQKDEIGRKVTGEGLIAITNWHLLAEDEDEDTAGTALDNPSQAVKRMLPITPGTSGRQSF